MVVLEARVDALEQEVAQMREEGKERHQAQIRVLNSLRVTQVEHGETFKEHSGILKEHGKAIADLRTEVGSLRTEVGGLRTEVGGLRGEVHDLRETQLEHGRLLHEVGIGMAGIARSLDYLINKSDQSPS
ncbi:MAG TPA: hypothetical protein VLL08_27400 [Kineosporiaceae bacterium]|nr:hypothetical protein [Kineosporiaceae bacterium]